MCSNPLLAEKGDDTIAVLIPCYNEGLTIGKVVTGITAVLPRARVYVYDNNSTDDTSVQARLAGAIVRTERDQGKGNVVRRMFADINAEVYLLLDGDGTYDTTMACELVNPVLFEGMDFVNGARQELSDNAYRAGHRIGNYMLNMFVRWIFGHVFDDMLSGYKAVSKRFVKSFSALACGFETETELTIHALELNMPCCEINTRYRERPWGSSSKLRTFQDGIRILLMILRLVKEERPLLLFAGLGAILAGLAIVFAIPLFLTYAEMGTVPRFPTAILCTGLALLSALCFCVAFILDGIHTARRELKRIVYLNIPPITAHPDIPNRQ